MNKRLLSFVFAIAFTFITALGCFSAISVSASTIELTDYDYENAEKVLGAICPGFPLIDEEVTSDAKPTTRAEFVAAVAMAMNVEVKSGVETPFSDVAAKNPYASAIKYAAGAGLINTVDLFYPDTPITYTQAIKIVMIAAGYGEKAEYMGGYPTGYLKVAQEAGVGQKLGLNGTEYITHAQATRIVFDAAVCDMMEITSFGDTYDYSITKGKNILSTYHKIYMAYGVVESNANTSLTNTESVGGDNTIVIDGEKFYAPDCDNFIGKSVRLFYGDDKANTVIVAYECGNNEYAYTNEDVLKISGLNLIVTPNVGTKDIRYTLETGYSVIYNGKFYGSADYNSVINPTSGSVALIDNDDNSQIDVIVIKDIEYGVIGSVNEFDEKVYDKYKKNGVKDLSDSSIKYFASLEDGTAIALDELEEGNVVGFAVSKDKKLYEIIRYTNRVGGTYDSKTSQGEIEVKGEVYKLSDYYTTNVKSLNDIKFGSEVILHLGIGNQVVYVEEFTTALRYGFVVAAGQENGLDGSALVKLYSDEGKMLELYCADKVLIDGTPKTSRSEIAATFDALIAKPYAYRVVKFALNGEGKLNKVFTATDNTQGTNAIYSQVIAEARPVIYYDSTKLVDGGVISDDPTVEVPYEIANTQCPYLVYGSYTPYFHKGAGCTNIQIPVRPADFSDDDKFNISPAVEEEYVRAVAYDVTAGGAASFVLVSNDTAGGSIGKYTGSSIIESITQGVNEDGEAVTILKLFTAGTWDKYYYVPETTKISKENNNGNGTSAQTELTINDFGPGDIIRMTTNSEKVITEMTMNFDASTKEIPTNISQSTSNGGRYVEFIAGYALGFDSSKHGLMATGMTPAEIVACQGNVPIDKTFTASFTRGTTVFITLNRNRQTNAVTSAVVSTEADLSSVETYFNSGSTMDYIVLRRYYREPSLNAIYVNIDE